MTGRTNIRQIALSLLFGYEREKKYANLLLSSGEAAALGARDKSYLTALLYTTVEHRITIDYYIASLAGRNINDISPRARDILRLGVCQLLYLDKTPSYASVNETVSLAKSKAERGFINAVLRELIRRRDSLPLPDKAKKPERYLSVKYSVSQEIVKLYCQIFGIDECEELLMAFSEPSPLSLTVNITKNTKEELMSELSELSPNTDGTELGIRINKSVSPTAIPGFDTGLFFVQDTASRIAGEVLSVGECDRVVDVCAAPGGKSFAAAMRAVRGEVFSFDLRASKLSLIKSGAMRLGLTNITVSERDATEPDVALLGTADRVICDVPCSGLGVLSKKPDIRYKTLDTLPELYELQYEILKKSSLYLKEGGLMVYSTCTVNPEENENITDRFIKENDGFEYLPFEVCGYSSKEGRLTLLPHKHKTDGFYIALITRKRVNK